MNRCFCIYFKLMVCFIQSDYGEEQTEYGHFFRRNTMNTIFNEEGRMDIDLVWERIKKGLKDGAAMSMEKIEEYTKVGKLKIEEMAAKRKIERNFVDIGERVFDLIASSRGGDIEADLAVKKAVENVKELRKELVEIDQKIKAASAEAKERRQKKEDGEEITGV